MRRAVLSALVIVCLAHAQESPSGAQPAVTQQSSGADQTYPVRDLPADQLRDYPGKCFGSTTFKFYDIGQSWSLKPFCGVAICLTDGVHLIERVRDCGLLPKPNPKCRVVNEADIQKNPFPECCPKFECEDGIKLEYPTPEELRLLAERNHQAQLAAVASQRQQNQGSLNSSPLGLSGPITGGLASRPAAAAQPSSSQ